LAGHDDAGPINVKVYGRDAWDGEMFASAWRAAWYRDGRSTARGRRLEYVEHEGFVTVLARQAGVRVPAVLTARLADNGDALIVTRPDGAAFGEGRAQLSSEQLDCLWKELGLLHNAGLAHNRIDLDRIAVSENGSIGFCDLASASVQYRPEHRLEDRAQLL